LQAGHCMQGQSSAIVALIFQVSKTFQGEGSSMGFVSRQVKVRLYAQ
jgi:hypothetical protein